MNLLIDTFSWKKFDILNGQKLLDYTELYQKLKLFITHEVAVELKHFQFLSYQEEQVTIIPISNQRIYADAIDLRFDPADASVLSNGSREGNLIIVSEDRPLLQLAMSYAFVAIQVADLFVILVKLGFLKRNLAFKMIQSLRSLKNISDRKFTALKTKLYS